MTAILGLCLLVVALLVIVGASGPAKELAHALLGVLLIVALARFLFCQLMSRLSGVEVASAGGWFWLLLAGAFIAVGAFVWKTRTFRQRRLEEQRRRHMHPRRLAPPAAPDASAEDEGMFP